MSVEGEGAAGEEEEEVAMDAEVAQATATAIRMSGGAHLGSADSIDMGGGDAADAGDEDSIGLLGGGAGKEGGGSAGERRRAENDDDDDDADSPLEMDTPRAVGMADSVRGQRSSMMRSSAMAKREVIHFDASELYQLLSDMETRLARVAVPATEPPAWTQQLFAKFGEVDAQSTRLDTLNAQMDALQSAFKKMPVPSRTGGVAPAAEGASKSSKAAAGDERDGADSGKTTEGGGPVAAPSASPGGESDDLPSPSVLPRRLTRSQSVISRMDTLSAAQKAAGGGTSSLELASAVNRLREELMTQTASVRIDMDSRMSSVSLEMDRLQKLLAIRPTIGEIHQLREYLTLRSKKLKRQVAELRAETQREVGERLARELAEIAEWKEKHEAATRDRLAHVRSDIERTGQDLQNMRNDVDGSVTELTGVVEDVQADLNDRFEEALEGNRRVEYSQQEMEARVENGEHAHSLLKERVSEIEAAHAAFVDQCTHRFETLQQQINSNKAAHEEAVEAVRATILQLESETSGRATKLEERVATLETGLKGCEEMNTAQNERMAQHSQKTKEQFLGLSEKLSESNAHIDAVDVATKQVTATVEGITNMLDEMEKKEAGLGSDIASLYPRVQELQEQQADTEAKAKEHNVALSKLSVRLTDFTKKLAGQIAVTTQLHDLQRLHSNLEGDVNKLREKLSSTTVSADKAETEVSEILERLEGIGTDVDRRVQQLEQTMERSAEQSRTTLHAAMSSLDEKIHTHVKNAVEAAGGAGLGGPESDEALEDYGGDMFGDMFGDMPDYDEDDGGYTGGGRSASPNGAPGSPGQRTGSRGGLRSRGGSPGGGGRAPGPVGAGSARAHKRLRQTKMMEMQRHRAVGDFEELLAEICITFEALAQKRTLIPELPATMAEQITSAAQEVAQLIAAEADTEAIRRMVRDNPDEVGYSDDDIAAHRRKMLSVMEERISGRIAHISPQPGLLRYEARQAFTRKLRSALEMAMSKHDAVMVLGHSRVGTMSIPTCVACDRPLVNKFRPPAGPEAPQSDDIRPTSEPQWDRAYFSQGPAGGVDGQEGEPGELPHGLGPESFDGGQSVAGSAASVASLSQITAPDHPHKVQERARQALEQDPALVSNASPPSTRPHTVANAGGFGEMGSVASLASETSGASGFVMRGGFRMPRVSSNRANVEVMDTLMKSSAATSKHPVGGRFPALHSRSTDAL